MNLAELFSHSGLGVMSTSSSDGRVDSALYARPHVIDETTLVWGMTDKRTYQNLSRNRHAAYLFKTGDSACTGVRLSLELIKTEDAGDLEEGIGQSLKKLAEDGSAVTITHAVRFKVTEQRPLI